MDVEDRLPAAAAPDAAWAAGAASVRARRRCRPPHGAQFAGLHDRRLGCVRRRARAHRPRRATAACASAPAGRAAVEVNAPSSVARATTLLELNRPAEALPL